MVTQCAECTQFRPRSSLLAFDVSARMDSCHPVTASEATQISSLVKDAEKDVRGYNARISWLRKCAVGLELERTVFEKRLLTAKSLLSPVRRLPLELMVEIFSYCCAENFIQCYYAAEEGGKVMVSVVIPGIILGQVCRAWHKVINANVRLWSTVGLCIEAIPNADSTRRLTLATRRMLEKSARHPLDVEVVQTVLLADEIHRSIRVLLAEHRRWIRASLFFHQPHVFRNQQFQQLAGHLPLLEHLDIGVNEGEVGSPETRIFATAPRLRSASIGCLEPAVFRLPWKQMHVLSLHRTSVQDLAYCLKKGTQLREVDISTQFLAPRGIGERPQNYILASDLQMLKLRFLSEDGRDTEKMLSRSAFPRLSSFALQLVDIEPPSTGISGVTLQSFLMSCSKTLKQLHFEDIILTENEFIGVLGLLPLLETLSVRDSRGECYFTSEVCDSMCGHGNGISQPILPCLISVNIDLDHGGRLSFPRLAKMVASRCMSKRSYNAIICHALETAAFAIRDVSLSTEEREEWKASASGGLCVTIIDMSGVIQLGDNA